MNTRTSRHHHQSPRYIITGEKAASNVMIDCKNYYHYILHHHHHHHANIIIITSSSSPGMQKWFACTPYTFRADSRAALQQQTTHQHARSTMIDAAQRRPLYISLPPWHTSLPGEGYHDTGARARARASAGLPRSSSSSRPPRPFFVRRARPAPCRRP